jgi:hyperosmotically inducible protein
MAKESIMKYLILFLTLLCAPAYAATAEPDNTKSDGIVAYIKDSAITAAVITKFDLQRSISDSKIHVITNNGIVNLSGSINSNVELDELKQIAESTMGVVKVDTTKLKIKKSAHPLADAAITTKVKGLFISDNLFGKTSIPVLRIHVETNNGIVYLSGDADSDEQIDNAIKIAQSVSGVSKVISIVTVVKK